MPIRDAAGGCTISVLAQPGARTSAIVGVVEVPPIAARAIKIKVAAPPVDGAANEALVEYLAQLLEVPKSRVRLARGASSKQKLFEVTGVSSKAAQRTLLGVG